MAERHDLRSEHSRERRRFCERLQDGNAGRVAASIAGADGSGPEQSTAEAEPGSDAAPQLIPFEEQETYRAGIPDDPHIDFCPTPEQIEAFAEETGVDLKPTPPGGRACSSKGALTPPDPPYPDPPEERMTDEELCRLEKQELLEAEPIPTPSGDPLELRGKARDGGEIKVFIDGDPAYLERAGIRDIHDLAEVGPC